MLLEEEQREADAALVVDMEKAGPLEPDPPDWGGEHEAKSEEVTGAGGVSGGSAAAGSAMDVAAKTRSAKRRKTYQDYLTLKTQLRTRPVVAPLLRDDPMEVDPHPCAVLTAREKLAKPARVEPLPSQKATQIWPRVINDGPEYGVNAMTFAELYNTIHQTRGADVDCGWMKPSVPKGIAPRDHVHGSHHTHLSSKLVSPRDPRHDGRQADA